MKFPPTRPIETITNRPQALISVYTDLLDFFFHCCELLKARHYPLAVARSSMHSKIANIVKSFSQHIEALDKSIIAATKDIVNQLAEKDINREGKSMFGFSNCIRTEFLASPRTITTRHYERNRTLQYTNDTRQRRL
jgi:hypothetical protein